VSSRTSSGIPGRILVNGKALDGARKLRNGDRLIFGHASCLRLVIPNSKDDDSENKENVALHQVLAEVVKEEEQIDLEESMALLQSIQERVGLTQAKVFFKELCAAMHLVDEGNMISSEVRPHDKYRFDLEVCTDIVNFTVDEPELVVRLYKGMPDGSEIVLGIFELPQYRDRLDALRDAYNDFRDNPSIVEEYTMGRDPWDVYTYREVQHLITIVLAGREAEIKKLTDMFQERQAELKELRRFVGKLPAYIASQRFKHGGGYPHPDHESSPTQYCYARSPHNEHKVKMQRSMSLPPKNRRLHAFKC
jgi:hypothetical protein